MTQMLTRPLTTENPFLRAVAGPQLTVGLGTAMGATFQNPTMGDLAGNAMTLGAQSGLTPEDARARDLQVQQNQFEAAQLYQQVTSMPDGPERDAVMQRLEGLDQGGSTVLNLQAKDAIAKGRMVEPTVLAEKYPELKIDRPMSEANAKLLDDNRKAQAIRDHLIQVGPQGIGPGIAKFGASLASMAVDPLEVATAFIPIVGEAGKAAAIARFGRIGGRVLVGAAEGGVGNALTEPLYYGMSQQQQLDYTMNDSLMNIGLGFVLGGGLGAVAGAVSRSEPRVRTPDVPEVSLPRQAETNVPRETAVVREQMSSDVPRLAEEQRPVAKVALGQFVNDQPVRLDEAMPRFSAQDAITALNSDIKSSVKYPLTNWLKGFGVNPEGKAAEELRAMGITSQTVPGLFKKTGRDNLDNIPASEHQAIAHAIGEDGNGYLSQDKLLQAVADEIAGRGPDIAGMPAKGLLVEAKIKAENELRAMQETHTAAKAAGLNLKTESEVAFVRQMIGKFGGTPTEQLAMHDPADIAAALAKRAQTVDAFADVQASRAAEDVLPYDETVLANHLLDLQSQADQLRLNEELLSPEQAADFAAIDAANERYKTYADVAQATATCLART